MKEFNFYIDDSGTRHPDRKQSTSRFGDWFALGGIVLAAEEEKNARQLHADFCHTWKITAPLHSVKIRHRSENFSWIGKLDNRTRQEFYDDLDRLVRELPVHALACIIDRPGYNARYAEKYGQGRWPLCKTAFPIIAERIAKFSALNERRVRLYIERSDKTSESLIKKYFETLRSEGMSFANGGDPKYAPLPAKEMKKRLYDLKFKQKSSPMVQIADLILYPLCKGAYETDYRPLATLKESGKLIEAVLPSDVEAVMGSKFSCFDQKK